jgi:hypothetical protein
MLNETFAMTEQKNKLKISVVMVDGSFRENVFGAECFSKQDFPKEDYEVFWVEFYEKAHPEVYKQDHVQVICLDNPEDTVYHSSFCFNEGIRRAQGEIIVIPDADQIVRTDFLTKVWDLHRKYDRLALYGYRYDEMEQGELNSYDLSELEAKCKLKNPTNYGGCLSVRKKWLEAINGYEQHPVMGTGFHANGLDIYTRFKNLGLAVEWSHDLKLYHPWHAFTLIGPHEAPQYKTQHNFIKWRLKNVQYEAIQGIDPGRNQPDFDISRFEPKPEPSAGRKHLIRRVLNKILPS